MTLKLNFSRIAKESAIDFFAPLTGMYKILTSDLATARGQVRPDGDDPAIRAKVLGRRAARPAANRSLATSAVPRAHAKG